MASDSSKEAFALLKWKRSLQNKNISLLSSWTLHFDNASNVPSHSKPKISPCAWVGISCNQVGRVISIDLSSMGLNGALQKFAFSSFPHLMHFNLSFNLFFGIIPPQVGNLSELLHLDLVLENLKYLSTLDLSQNQLSGSISFSLGKLSSLDLLYLYSNSFSGSIPSIIGNFKSLLRLDLSENQLNGSIPLSFGNLNNLTMMSLFSDSLSGSIPPNLGNLKSLSTLRLHINQLNGVISPSIANLSSLRTLFLYNNGLYGFVPEEIGCCLFPN
ncbi:hypothetical protein CISIN_1g040280mg [Citrus sinensis]|uniref:Disease resistance R13L4/SHOC-2-like LRR domain-containing protein n=1 Tax=Citrus sinensis TaxID=2711 RepID=A0A067FFH8_CITSI|nr:hypothetical protein CISIN_1g040280mg [Citrus sinensis]